MGQAFLSSSGALLIMLTGFCAERSQVTSRSSNPPIRSRHQLDYRQGARPDYPGVTLAARRRGDRVKRREFITLLGAAAGGRSRRARSRAGKLPTIGFWARPLTETRWHQ